MTATLRIELVAAAPATVALAEWLAGAGPANPANPASPAAAVALAPEDDALALAGHLAGLNAVVLTFRDFNDGRAYSQARLLRTRLAFRGNIVATGNVLVDQLPLMWRCGFDRAVLAPGKRVEDAEHYFGIVSDHYQGDARAAPHFVRAAPARPRS